MAQITFHRAERIIQWPNTPDIRSKETDNEMFAKLTCIPPLGQPTTIPAGQDTVDFIVLLETESTSKQQWQVALWHDLDSGNGEWSALDFEVRDQHFDIVRMAKQSKYSCVVEAETFFHRQT
jgi:hypothetical protein